MNNKISKDIAAIADASPEDFAHALLKIQQEANRNQFEDFKIALRDAVMTAFDDTTECYAADDLKDEHLPELFKTIENLAEELYYGGTR